MYFPEIAVSETYESPTRRPVHFRVERTASRGVGRHWLAAALVPQAAHAEGELFYHWRRGLHARIESRRVYQERRWGGRPGVGLHGT